MSSIFDEVDDELLQIFSHVSYPQNAEPFFQLPAVSPSRKTSDPTGKPVDNHPPKPPARVDNDEGNPNENKKRKIIHRDVERQRRQEMANLYSSLRSLLPQEYLKGKRSVSDHMHETVNYIKYLQRKTKELNEKRDSLKRLSNFSSINAAGKLQSYKQDLVMVRPSWTGVDIVVDTAISVNFLPLSTLVQVLEDEGLHIISCISTIIKARSIYTFECEVNGEIRDCSELQKRLTNLVLLYLN